MRVKAMASRCNDFTAKDFATGMKVPYRLRDRGEQGIIFRKGGYAHVHVPPNKRHTEDNGVMTPYYVGADDLVDEFGTKDLYCTSDAEADERIVTPAFPVSDRFVLVAYTDASFAVTDKMQSVSGWIIYVNGAPTSSGTVQMAPLMPILEILFPAL